MRFKGWKNIFSFNYIQQVKSKAFKGGTAVLCILFALIIAAINLLPVLLSGDFGDNGNQDEENAGLKALYIYNGTDFPIFDFAPFTEKNIECFELSEEDFESKCEEITSGDKAEAVLMISPDKNEENQINSITLTVFRPENEELFSKGAAEDLVSECRGLFKDSMLMSLGVDKNDLALAQLDFNTDVRIFNGEDISPFKEAMKIAVPMVFSVLLFSFIISYAQIIAQSIAMEKTSRVIELLITSVRPLAIITGKILAMLLVAITQIAIIGAVSGITLAVTAPFGIMSMGGSGMMGDAISAAGESASNADFIDIGQEITEALPGLFNPGSVIAILITMLLGFLFYALLAGLVGAGISRSEDLASAIQPLMMVAMAGFFLSYMSAAFNYDGDGNIIMTLSRYIPISSPFALPGAIAMGEMSAAETLISVSFLALLTGLMVLLVSKVYENIILYSGNPLKLGQIIKMAREK